MSVPVGGSPSPISNEPNAVPASAVRPLPSPPRAKADAKIVTTAPKIIQSTPLPPLPSDILAKKPMPVPPKANNAAPNAKLELGDARERQMGFDYQSFVGRPRVKPSDSNPPKTGVKEAEKGEAKEIKTEKGESALGRLSDLINKVKTSLVVKQFTAAFSKEGFRTSREGAKEDFTRFKTDVGMLRDNVGELKDSIVSKGRGLFQGIASRIKNVSNESKKESISARNKEIQQFALDQDIFAETEKSAREELNWGHGGAALVVQKGKELWVHQNYDGKQIKATNLSTLSDQEYKEKMEDIKLGLRTANSSTEEDLAVMRQYGNVVEEGTPERGDDTADLHYLVRREEDGNYSVLYTDPEGNKATAFVRPNQNFNLIIKDLTGRDLEGNPA